MPLPRRLRRSPRLFAGVIVTLAVGLATNAILVALAGVRSAAVVGSGPFRWSLNLRIGILGRELGEGAGADVRLVGQATIGLSGSSCSPVAGSTM